MKKIIVLVLLMNVSVHVSAQSDYRDGFPRDQWDTSRINGADPRWINQMPRYNQQPRVIIVPGAVIIQNANQFDVNARTPSTNAIAR